MVLPAFRAEIADHIVHVAGSGKPAVANPEFKWVQVMLGNLKNAITGAYHAFKLAEYAHRYLAGFQYRFNHRYDLKGVLGQLTSHASRSKRWPEARLRADEFRALIRISLERRSVDHLIAGQNIVQRHVDIKIGSADSLLA